MREITPPIGLSDRKWEFFTKRYYHVEQRGNDQVRVVKDEIDKGSYIGEVEVYRLAEGRPKGDFVFICRVYNFFGRGKIVQRWGFVDDVQNERGCVAMRVESPGKDPPYRWMLAESEDRFSLSVNPGPPYDTVYLAIRGNKGGVSRNVSIKK